MKRLLLLIVPLAVLLAAEPVDEAKKELNKLQGEWVMTALEIDGKPVAEKRLRDTILTIKGDKYTTLVKGVDHEATIKLDPSKKPKAIDMTFDDGGGGKKIGKGIYKLEGDTFVVCRAQDTDGARPTEFVTKPNTGYFVVTWKRKAKTSP